MRTGLAQLGQLFGASALIAACSARAPIADCPTSPAPSPAAALVTEPGGAGAPAVSLPALSIAFKVDLANERLLVTTTARADSNSLQSWSIPDPDPGAIRLAAVRDDAGVHNIRLAPRPEKALGFVLARPVQGALTVEYEAQARSRPLRSPVGVSVTPDAVVFSAEAALLLPDGLDNEAMRVMFEFLTKDVGRPDSTGFATSFGVRPSEPVVVRGRELRGASFAVGTMGTAVFDGIDGHDEAAWFGYTSFDPRPISADMAAFRTAAAQLFGTKASSSLTLLVIADWRPPGTFNARRRSRSIVVHLGAGEPWSAPVRIAVAAQILHEWIGEQLWLGPREPNRKAESAWFIGGVTRYLASTLLFRFGLITPGELMQEHTALNTVLYTSALREKPNSALGAEPAAYQLAVARGARYATRVDALLHERGKGTLTLAQVLKNLLAKGAAQGGALPVDAWLDELVDALGPGQRDEFARAIERGELLEIPAGALGPCFAPARQAYAEYDLGFDRDATWVTTPRTVVGVRPDSAASKAGLRNGDVLVETELGRGNPHELVRFKVERQGVLTSIEYKPLGAKAQGAGWRRVTGIPDHRCVP